ncbi:MAG: hypothetical protein OK449_06185 [Thaumarchaeota archaeon]|nr:hypothetical protein [Nitrososphaerota archaeon]
MNSSLLENCIVGFIAGEKTLLKVSYLESGKSVYHQYEGGPIWMATTPNDIGKAGQTLVISPELLTTREFLSKVPKIMMKNEVNFSWLPTKNQISLASDSEGFHFEAQQQPPLEGVSNFQVLVEPVRYLGFAPGKGCFLETSIRDFFGRVRKIRVYHDGHSSAWLGLRQGKRYPRVSLVSFDGVRLRLAYGSPRIRVASIYLSDPISLYSVERTEHPMGLALIKSSCTSSGTYRVELKRELEREMLLTRYRYPHGRIGSEIAYAIASRELRLDLILNDPSEGGADMMSRDGVVIFENRLVTITRSMSDELLRRQLMFQLGRLSSRLQSDLVFYRSAKVGYIFLSYLDSKGLQTISFEMKKR